MSDRTTDLCWDEEMVSLEKERDVWKEIFYRERMRCRFVKRALWCAWFLMAVMATAILVLSLWVSRLIINYSNEPTIHS